MKRRESHSSTQSRNLLSSIYRGLRGCRSQYLADQILKGTREADKSVFGLEPPDPLGYDDWRVFFRDYCTYSLCSKVDFLDVGVDRQSVAIEKFLLCEEACLSMNVKFRHPDVDPFEDPTVSLIFHEARNKIGRVLGAFSWDEAVSFAAFGPGAAVGVPRQRCHVVDKFGCLKPTVTGECATLAEVFIGTSPQWSNTVPVTSGKTEDNFSIVRGSRITTVPKSAKTDRVIAIEPLMNMFFQKGIGACIRRRLKTVKVNLDDQTRNQELARKGSLDGSLATIDLASASDSISRGLVEWLCPPDWVLAMKLCRSVRCTLPSGEEKFLQKFSSMGNGYTFELESLIFWALTSSVVTTMGGSTRDLGIYGDDIIVDTLYASRVIGVLQCAGFTTNIEKTFVIGPFRESCGKHYFQGHDVTPLYVRKDVADPERLLWLANSVRRLSHRLIGMGYGCDQWLEPCYREILSLLPSYLRKLSIPEGFGDGGVVRDFDEAAPKRHRSFDAFITKHVRREYSTYVPCNQPALTAALFFLCRRDSNPLTFTLAKKSRRLEVMIRGDVPLEKPIKRYKLKVVTLHADRWYGLGPWIAGF